MIRSEAPVDLAGVNYWDAIWRRSSTRSLGRLSYFHFTFARLLNRYLPPNAAVCEAGCAHSVWIPYLVRRGARVSGVDYSEPGLARLRARLKADRLSANLICTDLTSDRPFGELRFDLIFSLGLLEHFQNPAPVIRAFAAATAPKGIVLTVIPNLTGLWGHLQRRLDRQVFELHVAYDPGQLDRIHTAAGLRPILPAQYFGVFGPLLLHKPSFADRYPRMNLAALAMLWSLQQSVAWPAGTLFGSSAETALFSSHIVGVYRTGGV